MPYMVNQCSFNICRVWKRARASNMFVYMQHKTVLCFCLECDSSPLAGVKLDAPWQLLSAQECVQIWLQFCGFSEQNYNFRNIQFRHSWIMALIGYRRMNVRKLWALAWLCMGSESQIWTAPWRRVGFSVHKCIHFPLIELCWSRLQSTEKQ